MILAKQPAYKCVGLYSGTKEEHLRVSSGCFRVGIALVQVQSVKCPPEARLGNILLRTPGEPRHHVSLNWSYGSVISRRKIHEHEGVVLLTPVRRNLLCEDRSHLVRNGLDNGEQFSQI